MSGQEAESAGNGVQTRLAFARCSTSLVLSLDESSSIFSTGVGRPGTTEYWHQQINATAAAFEDDRVIEAIRSVGGIAVRVNGFNSSTRNLVAW